MIQRIKEWYTKYPVLKHLTAMFFLTLLSLWILSFFLNIYTRQGKTVVVPDLHGKFMNEVEEVLSTFTLKYEVVDSVFATGKPKGSVISQTPLPGTNVKEGRVIYLTIVTLQPEKIAMPNFVNLSLRQAKSIIETYGLRLGGFKYVPSEYKDAVLNQYYRGAAISPGTLILKGSSIELVVGDGGKQGNINVPFLYGKTIQEVKTILNDYTINLGAKIFENCDSSNGFVYKQMPEPKSGNKISVGGAIDVWLKKPSDIDFETLLLEKSKDTISQ